MTLDCMVAYALSCGPSMEQHIRCSPVQFDCPFEMTHSNFNFDIRSRSMRQCNAV